MTTSLRALLTAGAASVIACAFLVPDRASAQDSPSTASTPAPTPSEGGGAPGEDEETEDSKADERALYDYEGRRDPFRPTIGRDKEEAGNCAAAGTGSMKAVLLHEVKLTALVKTPSGSIATFEGGPEDIGYFARVGDEFCDGAVHVIDFETKTVTVRQKRDDPKRKFINPWRDVVIPLYPEEAEDAKAAKPKKGAKGRKR